MEIVQTIGYNVVKNRLKNHLTQEELAFRSKVSTRSIGKIERAEANPTIASLEKISNSLGISIINLMMSEDKDEHSV